MMPGSITCFLPLGALATQISHWPRVVILHSNATCNYGFWKLLTKIHELKSFLTQITSSSGKGPCSLTHERANRGPHVCAAKAYLAEFSNKHAHCEALEENANPQVFVPSGGVRHRPAKTKTGIEWTFVQKREQKKAAVN